MSHILSLHYQNEPRLSVGPVYIVGMSIINKWQYKHATTLSYFLLVGIHRGSSGSLQIKVSHWKASWQTTDYLWSFPQELCGA